MDRGQTLDIKADQRRIRERPDPRPAAERPRDQEYPTPPTTLARPKVNGVWRAIPWCSTSHGESPSRDSSMSTIAAAYRRSPKTRLTERTTSPPRIRGCARLCAVKNASSWLGQLDPRAEGEALGEHGFGQLPPPIRDLGWRDPIVEGDGLPVRRGQPRHCVN